MPEGRREGRLELEERDDGKHESSSSPPRLDPSLCIIQTDNSVKPSQARSLKRRSARVDPSSTIQILRLLDWALTVCVDMNNHLKTSY